MLKPRCTSSKSCYITFFMSRHCWRTALPSSYPLSSKTKGGGNAVELSLLNLSNERREPGDWSWTAAATAAIGARSCSQPLCSAEKAADTSCFQAWWAAGRPISDTQIKWRRGHTRDRLKWPELYQHFCKVNELIHESTKHKRTCRILAVRFAQAVVMDFNCRYRCVTQVLRWISWA